MKEKEQLFLYYKFEGRSNKPVHIHSDQSTVKPLTTFETPAGF